jgi:hypothetical protein
LSTKIYDGYRISGPDGTRPDVFAVLEQVKAAIEPTYRHSFAATLATSATMAVDLALVPSEDARPPKELPKCPIMGAYEFLSSMQDKIEKTGIRAPSADFQCEVTFFSDPQNPAGPLYARLFTERGDYTAAFEGLPGVEPWGYWNNTDAPEDVSASEWEQRRQTWNRLTLHKAPATVGLTWTLLGKYDSLNPLSIEADVAAAIPDRPTRARALARRRVPVAEVVDGNVRMRDAEQVRGEIDTEQARVEPLLPDVTIDGLYGRTTPVGVS